MRTVTFSDSKVAALVNWSFVAAWTDRASGCYRNEDYSSEKRIFALSYEGYPTRNICTFILSPDGRVFHYVAGYLSPELFVDFLYTALRLRDDLFDAQMVARPEAAAAWKRIHWDEAARYERALQSVRRAEVLVPCPPREYCSIVHLHNRDWCGWAMEETYGYLRRIHRHWAAQESLPKLEDVRFAYLYGNLFSEELRGIQEVKRDSEVPRPAC